MLQRSTSLACDPSETSAGRLLEQAFEQVRDGQEVPEEFSSEVLEEVAAGPELIARWAIPQGQGDLLGLLQGEQPVAAAVAAVAQGDDPATAAQQAAETARSVADSR